MSHLRLVLGLVASALVLWAIALPAPTIADTLIDAYVARLSEADHFNSQGKRLTKVAEIIRQDRANFHKRLHRDPEDESDTVFSDAANRELLEKRIARGRTSAAARSSIINGTPLIRVKIYSNSVDILVIRD